MLDVVSLDDLSFGNVALAFVAIFVLKFTWTWIQDEITYKEFTKVTPPESVPYFGTQLTTVINKNAHIVVPRIAAENKHISDGIFRFNAGPFLGHNAIIVNNLPEALKILRDRPKTWDRTPRVEAGFKLINLENLFSENRESWGRLRRLLAPAFNNKTVRECNSDIFLVTKRLLEVMRKTAEANDGAAVFDRDIFERFAFDSVALVSFGFDANSISDNRTDEEVKKSMEKREETNRVHERLGVPASVAVDEFFSFVGRTIVLQYPKWLWTARDRQASQYCERFCSIAHDLIDEARKEPPKLEKSENAPKHGALLRALVKASDSENDRTAMTDDELVKNSVTFIFAGTHTTSTSIAFSLLELANHPDIQQRLFDIVAPFKDENGFLDPDKCPPESLEFARAIFNESIRLWPPAFAVGMAARKPATIQGKKVPESTRVVIPVGALVRDERYFKDPDKFDPDRWGDLEKSNPGLSALCFGGGARVCPGRHLALHEGSLALASIVANFVVSVAPGAPTNPDTMQAFTMIPSNLKLQFTPRK